MITGYFLNKDKKKEKKIVENIKIVKPNGTNIYNSNMINEVENQMLEMSLKNYESAKNPAETGILPPLFNSYSVDYNTGAGITNTNIAGRVNEINKIKDPKAGEKVTIDNRPMFSKPSYGNSGVEREYYSYNDKGDLKIDEQKSLVTGLPLDTVYENREKFGNEGNPVTMSLLTGLPMNAEHANMVPFFGSNTKQNIERTTNESILDNYVGRSNTLYQPKREIGKLFSEKEQDINGTPIVTSHVGTDRYIKSIYRQNEKPTDDIKVSAEIAGTVNNNIMPKQITIDDIRIGNKKQETHEGRFIDGQKGNVRGVNGITNKNRPDTFYEKNQDHLFRTPGAKINNKIDENYSNLQKTNRNEYSMEYYGSGTAVNDKTKRRFVLDKNCDSSCVGDSVVHSSTKTTFEGDTKRNITGHKGANDYGKGGITAFETERDNEGTITNLHNSTIGIYNKFNDKAKTTIKETTEINRFINGNVKTQFDMGSGEAYNNGINEIQVPTTHKEMTIMNDYIGNITREDGMGYLVNKYTARPTEKDVLAERKYDAGPQKFNMAGSKNVTGEYKISSNKQLTSREDDRAKINGTFSQKISTKGNIGIVKTNCNTMIGDIENDRFNPEILNSLTNQYKNNPYSIYEKNP